MLAAYGQVTTGYWPAVVIGAALLLALIMTTVAAARRARRRSHGAETPASTVPRTGDQEQDAEVPHPRCKALITEALIVRERVFGQIDAATYQARMKDLAATRPERGVGHVEH